MNYKDTLFFIGKCLTINHESHNFISIENELKEGNVNWDNVVKVSTAHYVFPALYCNLKRANFLSYLPADLVEYMQHITDLNRERNLQIIEQAKEINSILLANNITPIFLKGTANLLSGLYNDIAERMVGDIDFLVAPEKFKSCINVLKDHHYKEFSNEKPNNTVVNRHFPKMVKKDRISSIEVHYKMVSHKKFSIFNYSFIEKNISSLHELSFLSDEDAIIMTSINHEVNDLNYIYKKINLKNSYDLFLLSRKESTAKAIKRLKHHQILNYFLYSTYNLLGNPNTIEFDYNNNTKAYFKHQLDSLGKPSQKIKSVKKTVFNIKLFLNVLLQSTYSIDHRKYLFEKIKSMF